MGGAPASTNPLLKIVRNPNFWLIVAMLAACATLHYGSHIQLIGFLSGRLPLGLTRHALDRILFLLPITYTGFVFGPVRGLITLSAAALIMFPRAILTSPAPADALLETTGVLIVGGLIILWFESLEREKALRAEVIHRLEVSEKNYRELFENASDAIWVQDMDGTIVNANKAAAELGGYTQQEVIGMNVRNFLSPEGFETARDVREKLLKGEALEQPYEQPLTRKDGTVGTVKVATSLLTRDGQPIGFQHIGRDVTEEKRMQDNLRFYAQQVTRAQEEERKRIARELHDETSQSLITLSRQLDTLIDSSDQLLQPAIKRLQELRQQVDGIQEGVRRFSQDLRPSVLDDLGLVPALEWLAANLSGYPGIDAEFEVVGEGRRLPHETELLLFRVAQEATRNVWRHAEASRVWVTVEFGEDRIKVAIQDNGKGFQLPKRLDDLASIGKLGLAGMWERAQLLSGTLTVQSEPGEGTTVVLVAPV